MTQKGALLLTVHFGDMENVVYNTSVYFNNVYSPNWFEDPFAQRIIKSIDRGTVLGPNAIETRALGIIPPEKLSAEPKRFYSCTLCPTWSTTPQTAATTARIGFCESRLSRTSPSIFTILWILVKAGLP